MRPFRRLKALRLGYNPVFLMRLQVYAALSLQVAEGATDAFRRQPDVIANVPPTHRKHDIARVGSRRGEVFEKPIKTVWTIGVRERQQQLFALLKKATYVGPDLMPQGCAAGDFLFENCARD
ncbi:hypothetical protein NBRC116599_43640 [Aquicoccus sp. SU-CL01552]